MLSASLCAGSGATILSRRAPGVGWPLGADSLGTPPISLQSVAAGVAVRFQVSCRFLGPIGYLGRGDQRVQDDADRGLAVAAAPADGEDLPGHRLGRG
jgi:hypothetical protein